MDSKLPLCIDCDGTLVRTDLLHESIVLLLKASPWSLLRLPVWLLKGKAYLKQRIAEKVLLDPKTLPYEPKIIAMIEQARAAGRQAVLVTASPRSQAVALANHLGIFDRIEATDDVNLSGSAKASHLVALYGHRGFDYAGNSRVDVQVWAASAGAIVVSGSKSLLKSAESAADRVIEVVSPLPRSLSTYARAMRVHQWLKNLLVFVPVLAAHELSLQTWTSAALAFVAFSLCASGVYLLNDMLDLPADRLHARKRGRPFASGAIPIVHGALLAPLLLLMSATMALLISPMFAATLMCYFIVTCLYSLWLKNQVVVDVLLLASLYTSRIIAGAAATSIVPSFWLLAFSMFMFLSLAIVKRYSEMLIVHRENKLQAAGRGYLASDLPVLMSLGTASGYIAIMVLALYVNSPDISAMYPRRMALWLALPPVLYWISRVWMKAHRGELHDDPVVFAATDRQTWLLVMVLACTVIAATMH